MVISEQVATKVHQIRVCASGYIRNYLGDQLWAGEPTYDSATSQWIAPIHARALPDNVVLGQMNLDDSGQVVQAPARSEIKKALKARLQTPVSSLHPDPTQSFSLGIATPNVNDPKVVEPVLTLNEEEMSIDQIAQILLELSSDPHLRAVWNNIRVAYANPTYRDAIAQAADTFASIARTG